jgi:hypothetical protein
MGFSMKALKGNILDYLLQGVLLFVVYFFCAVFVSYLWDFAIYLLRWSGY